MSSEVLEEYGETRILRPRRAGDLPVYSFRERLDPVEALRSLLADDSLEEVSYNGPAQGLLVYHRRHGFCRVEQEMGPGDAERLVELLLRDSGLGGDYPILEGMLSDGSRVSIVFEPIAIDGPCFSVRKFPRHAMGMVELIRSGMLSAELAALLWLYVDGLGARPANILIAGGAGSGKTTLLSALAQLIPPRSRIVIIEDTPELRVSHPNVVRLTVSPLHHRHQVDMERLLRAALRLRPDRIIVGEVRGREAETLLAAMNTGHAGSMGTIHANTTMEAVKRLTTPPMSAPPQMLDALDLIITTAMLRRDGNRRVVHEVAEVSGSDQHGPRLNVIYRFSPERMGAAPTGVPSVFRERFVAETGLTREEYNQALAEKQRILLAALGEELRTRDAFLRRGGRG